MNERIKYETEILKLLVLVNVAVAGGTVSLLFRPAAPLRDWLASLGIAASVGLGSAVWVKDRRIRRLLAQKENE